MKTPICRPNTSVFPDPLQFLLSGIAAPPLSLLYKALSRLSLNYITNIEIFLQYLTKKQR
jgi:hypothetical protein